MINHIHFKSYIYWINDIYINAGQRLCWSMHTCGRRGRGGRDGLAGVVIEGDAVGVDCLLLEPAIGKIKKNRKQCIQKIT